MFFSVYAHFSCNLGVCAILWPVSIHLRHMVNLLCNRYCSSVLAGCLAARPTGGTEFIIHPGVSALGHFVFNPGSMAVGEHVGFGAEVSTEIPSCITAFL